MTAGSNFFCEPARDMSSGGVPQSRAILLSCVLNCNLAAGRFNLKYYRGLCPGKNTISVFPALFMILPFPS